MENMQKSGEVTNIENKSDLHNKEKHKNNEFQDELNYLSNLILGSNVFIYNKKLINEND